MDFLIETKIGKSTINCLLLDDSSKSRDEIYLSWCNTNFLFKEEDSKKGVQGLRPPQVGSIFAALGFEKSDEKNAATIVMPTGTGKTETILSIVVAGKFKRTLVIVPSDALREQTKNKFVELGLLRKLGSITNDVANPIVATINHGVNDADELEKLLDSNVIVASVPALTKFSEKNLSTLIHECSHLIVDEAHHIKAATWARIKSRFEEKPVFQFTATPFRTDRSRVEGKIVFNYPLKSAQADNYFKPIEFHPVREFVEEYADKAIADKAIELLRKDLANDLEHILMARAYPTKRAEEVFKLYEKETDLNPVLIHSKIKNKSKVIEAIKNR